MLFFSFFKTLKDCEVTIELKNGLKLTGTLETVDAYHNVKLKNVQAVEPEKYPHFVSVEQLFIRGSVIRHISIPPEQVDLDRLHEACRRANSLTP